MSTFKKFSALLAAASLTLGACSSSDGKDKSAAEGKNGVTKLIVGASPVPHSDILQFVNDKLAKDAGIELEIKQYTDYVQPNVALNAGEIDVNFYQHLAYYQEEAATKGYKFEVGKPVHIEPIALYSNKYKKLEDIPDGATIVINNDPSNQARGLKLLQDAKLIKLSSKSQSASIADISENPKHLKIKESEAAAIPVQLADVDAAVINGNFAQEAKLKPADSLFIESVENNPYANILAWRPDNKKIAAIKKLEKLIHSPAVAKFITEKYPDKNIIPAFK